MKNRLIHIRKYTISLLIAAFCVCVGAFFSTSKVNEQISANAASHNCYLLGSNADGIGQQNVDYLLANIETPENVGITPSEDPYMFYLTEDISWDGEFIAPDGVFVAICLNGHTATGAVNNDKTTGGVYFFQCGIHDCEELDTQIPVLPQGFFDLIFKAGISEYVYMKGVLSEDVVLNDEWTLGSSSELYICKNGYTLTGGENMTADGGVFDVCDCSLLHNDCFYFGSDGFGIGQDMIDQLLVASRTPEAWDMEPSEEPYCVYLYENVAWEGDFAAPDGVKIALCLNGHSINGNINNDLTTGHIYVMQCGLHSCPVLGETLMAISSGYVELMEDLMLYYGETVDFEPGTQIALLDDVALRYPEVWAAPASNSVTFCTCGHSITNLEFMRVNGAAVNTVDCSDISAHTCEGLGGVEAEYLTQSGLTFKTDSNGVLQGESKQTICLVGNIVLRKTLVIPSGMSVKLCLNGFTITSPKIRWGQQDLQGNVILKECCTAIQVMPGASLTVCDCSESHSGRIVVDFNDMNGWGALAASAVLNSGSFTLHSGTLVGVMALLNAGDVVIDGGNVVGLLAGVAQGLEVVEDVVVVENPSFEMNGGEVHSAAIGVAGSHGDLIVNDGLITAQVAGLGTGFDIDNPEGDAVLYLNGGEIHVGKVETKAYIKAGLPIDDEDLSFGISAEICAGVIVSTTLVLGGDVVINIEGPLAEEAETTVEILMADGAVLKSADDVVIENVYEATASDENAVAIIEPSLADNIVPASSSMASKTEDGTLSIVKNDGTFKETAKVTQFSLSLKGAIQANFYVVAEEEFVNNPDARVIIMYRGEKLEYKISEGTKKNEAYIFSVNISAKDYQKNIHCSFTDGTNVWFGGSSTVNQYLNWLINYQARTMSLKKFTVQELGLRMQNYCMAASYHFGVAEDYVPNEALQEELESVTLESLEQFAAKQSGSSSNLRLTTVTLFLQAETTIRFYFKLNSGVDISDVTLTLNGEEVTAGKSGSTYYIDIKNIKAQKLGTSFEVNLDGLKVEYSAMTYAYSVLRQEKNNPGSIAQDLLDVARGLALYFEAAYGYFS